MFIRVPTIMRSTEAKRADFTIQFLIPVVKRVVAMRMGRVKEMAGRILPEGLKKRLVISAEEKILVMMPK